MRKNFISENFYKRITHSIPICCVDVVTKKRDSVILVKRLERPVKGKWWFPGGRILFNESLKSAVRRKLKEELNIKKLKRIELLSVGETRFSKGRFNKPTHTINIIFLVELDKKNNIHPDNTILEYKWFNKVQRSFHPYIKKFLKLSGFK